MNQTFNATPVMTSSLAVSVLLNMLGSGLMTVKRFGAPFSENHYVLNDLAIVMNYTGRVVEYSVNR